MNKPIITREQADAIERLKKDAGSMSFRNLCAALRDGYEVEPEFKLNDYVHHVENNVTQKLDTQEKVKFMNNHYIQRDKLRHATPSEIAEEKERRWWKKHGRDVCELKNGDVLVCDDYPRIVNKIVDFEEKTVIFSDKDWEYYENVIEEYEVVCFAENRLDREGGE